MVAMGMTGVRFPLQNSFTVECDTQEDGCQHTTLSTHSYTHPQSQNASDHSLMPKYHAKISPWKEANSEFPTNRLGKFKLNKTD